MAGWPRPSSQDGGPAGTGQRGEPADGHVAADVDAAVAPHVPRRPSRIGMRQVAELAGVSVSSVSRVLVDHPNVSPALRRRVLTAVEQLGYEPNPIAQSLRRGDTRSVAMVMSSLANPVHGQIVAGAEAVLRQAGFSLIVMETDNDPQLDIAHIKFLSSGRVDGLLLLLSSDRLKATQQLLRRIDLPVVAVDRELPPKLGASACVTDHRPGTNDAIKCLADSGHRRIGLVSGDMQILPARARAAAVFDAIREIGPDIDCVNVSGSFSAQHGAAACTTLLDLPRPPDAIIAGGNLLLVGCLTAMYARGIHPGVDIALVSCDDVPLSQLHRPPIATIDRDLASMGQCAAELLLRRLSGEVDGPERVDIPTFFIRRDSLASRP